MSEAGALRNQTQVYLPVNNSNKKAPQVYLPVNNSLSHAGHVEKFLAEMGQGVQHLASRVEDLVSFVERVNNPSGVQHLASRVEDLVSFVERVNNYRAITKRGFSFLSIPRSYYGVLTPQHLQAHADISEAAPPVSV
ncbi:hypothetical protein T484DRAFT_1804191 [Baffinella frigidus]|nr:hypothetical protein T484DRAFT_1804191 [Cryptophyta sp. CCMP2293]